MSDAGTAPNSGLKGQWGVGNPQGAPTDGGGGDTGSDKQAQEFQAAFQQAQGAINGHLQYTAANAEASAHAGFATRRDAMYSAYQAAAAKIDRNNPAQAQGDIDKVLADERALGGEVATFRQAAEKAKNDWDARQPQYDEAVHHIEELEAWEDKDAPALRGQADKILTQTNERRYADASTALDVLLPQLAPVYEEYVRQRDAKAKYEPARDALADRVAKVAGNDRARLQPERDAVGTARNTMEASANEKNFVQALEQVGDLTGKLETFEAALEELDRKKKEFEAANAELEKKLTEVQQSTFRKLEQKQQEIVAGKAAVDAAAGTEDYDQAMTLASELSNKCEEYRVALEKLEQERKAYQEAWDALQDKLKQTEAPSYQKLEGQKQGLADGRAAIDAAVQEEDFVKAKTGVDDLAKKVDEYLAAVAKLDEQKKAYEDAWNAVQDKLSQTDGPPYKKLDVQRQDLAAAKSSIEAAVQQEDFENAKTLVDDLSNKCDAFLAAAAKLDEQKQAFDKAWNDVQSKLGQLQTSVFKKLQPMLDDINKTKGEIDAAAQAEEYETALPKIGDLSNAVDAYLKKEEDTTKQKEAFEAADTELGVALLDGIDKVSAPSLAAPADALRSALAGIKPAIEAEDYEKALQLTTDAKGKASALRAEADSLRQSINGKVDAIETDVAQLDVGNHPVKTRIDELIAAIRGAAQSNAQLDKAEKDLAELPKLVQQLKDDPAAKLRNNADYQAKLRAEQEALEARDVARADYERAKAALDGTKVPNVGVTAGMSKDPSGSVTVSGDPASASIKSKEVDLAKSKLTAAENKLDRAYQDRIKVMQKAGWKGKLPEKGQDYPRAELTDFLKK